MRTKNILTAKSHACRSFFVYKDGNLFCQLNKSEAFPEPLNSIITLRMKGAIISGRYVEQRGTGIVLDEWFIERR